MRKSIGTSFAVAALFACTPVLASEQGERGAAQVRIGMTGHVPVICRVSIDRAMIPGDAGQFSIGTLSEFCNNPNGYRVVMDYSALAGGGHLLVDGQEIALDEAGSVVVSRSAGAAVVKRSLAVSLARGGQAGTFTFRIEPQ